MVLFKYFCKTNKKMTNEPLKLKELVTKTVAKQQRKDKF